jgi:hypothetical protein
MNCTIIVARALDAPGNSRLSTPIRRKNRSAALCADTGAGT